MLGVVMPVVVLERFDRHAEEACRFPEINAARREDSLQKMYFLTSVPLS